MEVLSTMNNHIQAKSVCPALTELNHLQLFSDLEISWIIYAGIESSEGYFLIAFRLDKDAVYTNNLQLLCGVDTGGMKSNQNYWLQDRISKLKIWI